MSRACHPQPDFVSSAVRGSVKHILEIPTGTLVQSRNPLNQTERLGSRSNGEGMKAQQQYDGLDSKQKRDILLKIGETREEARVLSQRDYDALGGWVKTRLKRHWKHLKA